MRSALDALILGPGRYSSPKDSGFRYVERQGDWLWVHPAELRPTDRDCTDMTDDEFERYVIQCHQKRSTAGLMK